MKALERELRQRFGARIRSAMPLAELTSFRIGGPADLFVAVEDEAELMHAKAAAYRWRMNWSRSTWRTTFFWSWFNEP